MNLTKKSQRIILIVVIVIIIIFALNFFQRPVRNFFYSLSYPLQRALWGAGDWLSDFFIGFFRADVLKKQTEELYLENLRLKRENIALQNVKLENKTLKESLGIGLEKEFSLALARPIGKVLSQSFILIDKGSKRGLANGQAVITKEKILCGRLNGIYEHFSRVELISNKGVSFDVVLGNDALLGVARGKGSLNLFIELLPQEARIGESDLVLTTASGGIFPAGLLVGEVKKVLKSDIEPFQQVEVRLACDIKNIKYLFVVTEY